MANVAKEDRAAALELAIKTVSAARHFTVAQIINTAHQYDQYISDGTVPPIVTAPFVDAKAEALDNIPRPSQNFREGDYVELGD